MGMNIAEDFSAARVVMHCVGNNRRHGEKARLAGSSDGRQAAKRLV